MATADAPFSAVNMVQDATKFAGKHGAWRRSHADMSRLFAKMHRRPRWWTTTGQALSGLRVVVPASVAKVALRVNACAAHAGIAATNQSTQTSNLQLRTSMHLLTAFALASSATTRLMGHPLCSRRAVAPPSTFPREAGSWQRQRQQRWRLASRLHGGETESRGYHLRSVSTPHSLRHGSSNFRPIFMKM